MNKRQVLSIAYVFCGALEYFLVLYSSALIPMFLFRRLKYIHTVVFLSVSQILSASWIYFRYNVPTQNPSKDELYRLRSLLLSLIVILINTVSTFIICNISQIKPAATSIDVLGAASVVLISPFCEELVFRKCIISDALSLTSTPDRVSDTIVSLVSAAAFGSFHALSGDSNVITGLTHVAFAFCYGFAAFWIRRMSGSFLSSWVVHLINNILVVGVNLEYPDVMDNPRSCLISLAGSVLIVIFTLVVAKTPSVKKKNE